MVELKYESHLVAAVYVPLGKACFVVQRSSIYTNFLTVNLTAAHLERGRALFLTNLKVVKAQNL